MFCINLNLDGLDCIQENWEQKFQVSLMLNILVKVKKNSLYISRDTQITHDIFFRKNEMENTSYEVLPRFLYRETDSNCS